MKNDYGIERNGMLNGCSIFGMFLTVECFDPKTCYCVTYISDRSGNKNEFIRAKNLIYNIPLEVLDGIVCAP